MTEEGCRAQRNGRSEMKNPVTPYQNRVRQPNFEPVDQDLQWIQDHRDIEIEEMQQFRKKLHFGFTSHGVQACLLSDRERKKTSAPVAS